MASQLFNGPAACSCAPAICQDTHVDAWRHRSTHHPFCPCLAAHLNCRSPRLVRRSTSTWPRCGVAEITRSARLQLRGPIHRYCLCYWSSARTRSTGRAASTYHQLAQCPRYDPFEQTTADNTTDTPICITSPVNVTKATVSVRAGGGGMRAEAARRCS